MIQPSITIIPVKFFQFGPRGLGKAVKDIPTQLNVNLRFLGQAGFDPRGMITTN